MKQEVWLVWLVLGAGAGLVCQRRCAASKAHVSRKPHMMRLELDALGFTDSVFFVYPV